MFRCQFCVENPAFAAETDYTKHMFRFHRDRPDFSMVCGHGDCQKTFHNYKTRMGHVKSCHGDEEMDVDDGACEVFDEAQPPASPSSSPDPIGENERESASSDASQVGETTRSPQAPCEGHDSEFSCEFEVQEGMNIHEGAQCSKESEANPLTTIWKTAEAEYVFSLRAKNLPAPVISEILQNTEVLVQSCLEDFGSKITQYLMERNIQVPDLDMASLIQESSACFVDIKTKWNQDKFLKDNMNLIEPKKATLDVSVCREVPSSATTVNRPTKLVKDSYHYVSLVDTLKWLYSNPNFVELLKPVVKCEDGVFRSCADGSYYQDNPILCADPNAVVLELYSDGVNCTDTLSSRPVKMTMFYFTILNIAEEHRSGLHTIFFLMAVESHLIVRYGINAFLKPLASEVIELQKGIVLPNGKKLFGTLFNVLGDNLASAESGGFKCGFTAFRCCRVCNATLEELRCMVKEIVALLRTKEQYNRQVEELESCVNDEKRQVQLSKEFGLNFRSDLNCIPHYHVVCGLPPDIFHDVIEGAVSLTVPLVLRHYLIGAGKIMTLSDFNLRLSQLDFGYSQTRPTAVLTQHLAENGHLNQTGSQMWSLANVLPLILEPLVNPDDEYWLNFSRLLQITSLLFGHNISQQEVALLSDLIEDYLTCFQKLYNRHLIPKQHFMVHYPRLITCVGPLSIYSTLRMEGKHQYFLDVMRKLKSFKNPSLTMAKQHQIYLTKHFTEKVVKSLQCGQVKDVLTDSLPFRFLLPEDMITVQTVSTCSLKGFQYKANKCLVLVGFQNDLPKFGSLVQILLIGSKPQFVCNEVSTVEYDLYKNMYKIIVSPEKFFVIDLEMLKSPEVYHKHDLVEGSFVIVKRNCMNL